jgi:hypothetical protein
MPELDAVAVFQPRAANDDCLYGGWMWPSIANEGEFLLRHDGKRTARLPELGQLTLLKLRGNILPLRHADAGAGRCLAAAHTQPVNRTLKARV